MTTTFPTTFFNPDLVLPPLSDYQKSALQSEQCVVIISNAEFCENENPECNLKHQLKLEIASLYKTHKTDKEELVWLDSQFDELNVRGWVILPDLDQISREPLPEDSGDVLVICQHEENSDFLQAFVTNEVDTEDSTFVGWFPMPDTTAAIGHLKNTSWI